MICLLKKHLLILGFSYLFCTKDIPNNQNPFEYTYFNRSDNLILSLPREDDTLFSPEALTIPKMEGIPYIPTAKEKLPHDSFPIQPSRINNLELTDDENLNERIKDTNNALDEFSGLLELLQITDGRKQILTSAQNTKFSENIAQLIDYYEKMIEALNILKEHCSNEKNKDQIEKYIFFLKQEKSKTSPFDFISNNEISTINAYHIIVDEMKKFFNDDKADVLINIAIYDIGFQEALKLKENLHKENRFLAKLLFSFKNIFEEQIKKYWEEKRNNSPNLLNLHFEYDISSNCFNVYLIPESNISTNNPFRLLTSMMQI